MTKEILPGIFEIRTMLPEGFVNSYLLIRGRHALLVDTGTKETAVEIFGLLEKIGLPETCLTCVLNTHSHPNHIGSNAEIKTRAQCEIVAHPEAIPWIENHERLFAEVYDQFGRYWPATDAFKRRFFDTLGKPAKVDTAAQFNQPLAQPGFEDIQLIPLPGHQKDCLGVFLPDKGILLAGDAVQRRGLGNRFQQIENRQAYLDTLNRIRHLHPNWLLLSHFDPLTGEALTNFLNQSEAAVWEIDYRIATVTQQLGENAPLWDVAKAVHEGAGKKLDFTGLLTIRAHLREKDQPNTEDWQQT
jgi:glyoxylase-like metal-dependent hydrolase (beta-lactamase superfamily II)